MTDHGGTFVEPSTDIVPLVLGSDLTLPVVQGRTVRIFAKLTELREGFAVAQSLDGKLFTVDVEDQKTLAEMMLFEGVLCPPSVPGTIARIRCNGFSMACLNIDSNLSDLQKETVCVAEGA